MFYYYNQAVHLISLNAWRKGLELSLSDLNVTHYIQYSKVSSPMQARWFQLHQALFVLYENSVYIIRSHLWKSNLHHMTLRASLLFSHYQSSLAVITDLDPLILKG